MSFHVTCVSGRRELKDFFHLPHIIYRDDDKWIAPLVSESKRILSKKNPYFRYSELYLFNCYDDRASICARTALVINKGYDKEFGKRTALFGFFESINNNDAAEALFDAVKETCDQKGVKLIIGPFNPNHYSEIGILTGDPETGPSFFQTYNPPYYCELLSSCGFKITHRIHTRKRENISVYLHSVNANKKFDIPDGYNIRTFNIKKKNEDLEVLREIYNDAFSTNKYFLNVSGDEYRFAAKYVSLVTDPDMIIFVEYKGKPAGVIQFAYDINPLLKKFNGKVGPLKYYRFIRQRKDLKKIILYAAGIKKSFINSPVSKLLLAGSIELLKKFDTLECTWISDDNIPAIRPTKRLGLEPDKHFVMFSKEL